MGYRSDVRIIMSKNGFKEFKKYVEEHIRKYKKEQINPNSVIATVDYDFNLLNNLDVSKQSHDGKQVYIGWNDLKWYYGWEDIDAIMDSLDKLEKNGYGYSYRRIGESYDDIETQHAKNTERDNVDELYFPEIMRSFDDYEYEEVDLFKDRKKGERDDR